MVAAAHKLQGIGPLTICQFSKLSAHHFSISGVPEKWRNTAHRPPFSTHAQLHTSLKLTLSINQSKSWLIAACESHAAQFRFTIVKKKY